MLSVVLLAAIFAAGCPERRSIADIEANPSRYRNKEIAIAGTVRDAYGANIPLTNIHGGVYKIDDGTGTMWVFTDKSVPSKGTRIGVKGKLQDGLNWMGKNYGLGIYENDRRYDNGK